VKILTLDNERSALNILNRAIEEVAPESEIRSFSKASEAVREISENGYRPDAAFLDIEMPGMNGLELAGRIKQASPATWIIFVTGFSQYALDAYSVHASGYLLKPATPEKIRGELEQIGQKPLLNPEAKPGQRIRVQCFGNFEVFLDGHPLNFTRKRAKELFAYLVHKRGTVCTTREMASVLFEDAPYDTVQKSYLQTIVANLCHTLKDAGEENIIVKNFGTLAIDPSLIDCDYYRFIEMDQDAVNSYTGEYMSQYAWGEFTVGFLNRKV